MMVPVVEVSYIQATVMRPCNLWRSL